MLCCVHSHPKGVLPAVAIHSAYNEQCYHFDVVCNAAVADAEGGGEGGEAQHEDGPDNA